MKRVSNFVVLKSCTGYRLYQRYESGEWQEKTVAITSSISATSFVLRDLPCGSDVHFYATAWNAQGISSPSEVLVTSTRGSLPLRPQPSTLVEINSTCVTLRLYAWPENDCLVQYWKVLNSLFENSLINEPLSQYKHIINEKLSNSKFVVKV